VERREVVRRAGPRDLVGGSGRGAADVVVGAMAERVEARVELVDPREECRDPRRGGASYRGDVRSEEWARDAAAIWDIAVPSRPGLPGVSMAGFRARTSDPVDLHVVPYPAVTVAVDFSDEPVILEDAGGRRQRGSAVAGIAPGELRARGRGVECLQVRLSPVIAHAVLGGGAPESSATVVALDDLWGGKAEQITARLRGSSSWAERFAIVEAALGERVEAGRPVDREVAFAWGRIVRSGGQVRVEQLAVELGWSRKRLWSRFRSQLGLTPKQAAQLVRFDQAAHLLAAGHGAARVAAETGYVDQSHLHRDVMAFAGVTPTVVSTAPWLAVDEIAWATTSGSW
jgi:AraC-like DNA-binding protein